MSNYPTPDTTSALDELIIDSLETLKVLADPLRKRILGHFDQPRTVKEVARQLNTSPSKLYYHVNMLEEHGLLRVTETRIVSGIIEKQYQIAARIFRVRAGLLSPTEDAGDEGLNMVLNDVLDSTREEILASVRAGVVDLREDAEEYRKLRMGTMTISLTPEKMLEFYERLRALIEEMTGAHTDEDDPDAIDFMLQYTMFPIARLDMPPGDEAE